MNVTGSQVDVLANLLDAVGLRHNVIAQNVANVNTPGYRRLEVTFEDDLAKAMQPGKGLAAAAVEARVVEAQGGPQRMDGNNVDMDAEMGRLNKNLTLYKTYAQILAVQLAQMRSAISGQ